MSVESDREKFERTVDNLLKTPPQPKKGKKKKKRKQKPSE